MSTMMRCGHAAQGTIAATGAPACLICAPAPGAYQALDPDRARAALAGRLMRCSYARGRDGRPCGGRAARPSDPSAAFFGYQPDQEFDTFYDGCWGWD